MSWSGSLDLRRERPLADARDVRLRDADHAVDPAGADADTCCGGRGDRVRRRHERIRAVVEVEERRLRTLEEHALAVAKRVVDVERRVGDVRPQSLRVALVLRRDGVEVERLRLVDALEPEVLLCERDLDLLPQDLRVEHVLHADAEPHRLVGVARPDPAPRRPDGEAAEAPLARLVDREMPRHDQMRVARDVDLGGRAAALLELVELADQHLGIDDAAVADHARLAAHDAARQRADLERLVADDDRVAGVRAALVAAHDVRVLREQVDDLPLAFVAPLRTDDDGRRHAPECRPGVGPCPARPRPVPGTVTTPCRTGHAASGGIGRAMAISCVLRHGAWHRPCPVEPVDRSAAVSAASAASPLHLDGMPRRQRNVP